MPKFDGPPPESLAALRLPSSAALIGRAFALDIEGGGRLDLRFPEAALAEWTATGVPWAGSGTDAADVVEVAPGTWFVDVDFDDPGWDAVTVVIRESTGFALIVHQHRFHPEETWSRGPEVEQRFLVATIEGAATAGEPPAPTRDLVGVRHLHRYSPHNLYEHIYLNSEKFCAHNVSTFGTPGRADCHPCTTYALGDGLYLFAWREYDSAAAMITLIDLPALRVTGKVHDPEHFMFSRARYLGGTIIPITERVEYPDGLAPR